jgi:hypothetical protein
MLKTAIAVAALAGALLIGPSARSPVQAVPNLNMPGVADANVIQVRRGFGGARHFGGGRFYGGQRFHGAHIGRHRYLGGRHFRHRHFGHRHYYYGGVYLGGGGCRWLRYKAIATGSSYWWRRYHRCRRGW